MMRLTWPATSSYIVPTTRRPYQRAPAEPAFRSCAGGTDDHAPMITMTPELPRPDAGANNEHSAATLVDRDDRRRTVLCTELLGHDRVISVVDRSPPAQSPPRLKPGWGTPLLRGRVTVRTRYQTRITVLPWIRSVDKALEHYAKRKPEAGGQGIEAFGASMSPAARGRYAGSIRFRDTLTSPIGAVKTWRYRLASARLGL